MNNSQYGHFYRAPIFAVILIVIISFISKMYGINLPGMIKAAIQSSPLLAIVYIVGAVMILALCERGYIHYQENKTRK